MLRPKLIFFFLFFPQPEERKKKNSKQKKKKKVIYNNKMIKITILALFVIIPVFVYSTIPSFSELNIDFDQMILGPKPEGIELTVFNKWLDPLPSLLVMLEEIGWAS